MEFRKNDILTLDIEDCGVDGEGIGKADGFTVFVKDAVIGDRIKAKIIKAHRFQVSKGTSLFDTCD